MRRGPIRRANSTAVKSKRCALGQEGALGGVRRRVEDERRIDCVSQHRLNKQQTMQSTKAGNLCNNSRVATVVTVLSFSEEW